MRILLVTGSSGGHIFPALALMQRLKVAGADLLIVLPKKSNEHKILAECGKVSYIHTANLSFNLSGKSISAAYFFLIGAWEGLRLITKFKPDVVIGFGSLHTVSLLFWAWLFRIKTVIHEQNVLPGRANRLLARFVDKVAVSFAQTSAHLNISREKIVLTGNPIRKDLVRLNRREALDFFNFQEGKFNILITGGSQGAHKLNTVCSAALSGCDEKDSLQLVHISGIQDFVSLKQSYAQSGLRHEVFDFLPHMQYAYSFADLVICRAGATTIAELQKFSLPALLIPYPFAYAHQLSNARLLQGCGSALIIQEEELCVEGLREKIRNFMKNPQELKIMRQGYSGINLLNATDLLAHEVLSLN
jgi:UDP-N-acetylglucosamine--N-acetylmuramyl-(pentapeptide) pyrophosphoryl-undecaprenol N-acetylglucosamine transferase